MNTAPEPLTVTVRGVPLRSGPAREARFKVAKVHADMRESVDMSPESQLNMLHREGNQELLSLEIAAQSIVDFPDAPWELRLQLARQCWDEARHAQLRFQRMQELGGHIGAFPILNQEWGVVCMLDSIAARLAVQNRTFEGGALDVLRMAAQHWRDAGDERTAQITETILADEIQHVRFANQWLKRMSADEPRVLLRVAAAMEYVKRAIEALSPQAGERSLNGVVLARVKRRITPNAEDRRAAGFTEPEIAQVVAQAEQSGGS